jgi:hypothetical protein
MNKEEAIELLECLINEDHLNNSKSRYGNVVEDSAASYFKELEPFLKLGGEIWQEVWKEVRQFNIDDYQGKCVQSHQMIYGLRGRMMKEKAVSMGKKVEKQGNETLEFRKFLIRIGRNKRITEIPDSFRGDFIAMMRVIEDKQGWVERFGLEGEV